MNLLPFKFNADYELGLLGQSSKAMNATLEFFLFFLEERPIVVHRDYDEEYLSYVESLTQKKISIVDNVNDENWWGEGVQIELEKKLNSKYLVTEFEATSQLVSWEDSISLDPTQKYVAKSLWGMSGRKMLCFHGREIDRFSTFLKKNQKVILEPYFERVYDFSQFFFPNNVSIAYENFIDQHFHYKGTFFNNRSVLDLENLSFYGDIDSFQWKKFREETQKILDYVRGCGGNSFFSVDSFVYLDNGKKKLRTLSEINYRKTMGHVTWLLAQIFSAENSWVRLVLKKENPTSHFQKLHKIKSIQWSPLKKKGCILLSPPQNPFEVYFLTEENPFLGQKLLDQFEKLVFLS